MPPLICFSPNVIDHTFPKSNRELERTQTTLSSLTSSAQNDQCVILLTQALVDFILELEWTFCWEVMKRYPSAETIYRLLAELGLQPHGVIRIDVSRITDFHPHPLPKDTEANAFSLTWSRELGRLWKIHSEKLAHGRHCVGVACTLAFSGEGKGSYENPDKLPVFPLIGPQEIGALEDCFEWDLPSGIHKQRVSFDEARKRLPVLGGNVSEPKGSSHYQVRFAGARTWPLDRNIDPVPDDFLRELVPITGQPLEVIKYVLLNGDWPARVFRLR